VRSTQRSMQSAGRTQAHPRRGVLGAASLVITGKPVRIRCKMSFDWPAFDPQDARIVQLGNEAFGAYCRASRMCEANKTASISDSDAKSIADEGTWIKIIALGFAIVVGERFKIVPMIVKAKKRKPTVIPDDFVLDDKMRAFATERHFDTREIQKMLERFVDYHQIKGDESADWFASWRTWVRNQVEFAIENGTRRADGTPFSVQSQLLPTMPRSEQPSLADIAKIPEAPIRTGGARFRR